MRRSPAAAGSRRGGAAERPERQVVMLQRKAGRMGRGLGVSTGWVLRLLLAKRKVAQVTGVTYRRIDDAGAAHHGRGRGARGAGRHRS